MSSENYSSTFPANSTPIPLPSWRMPNLSCAAQTLLPIINSLELAFHLPTVPLSLFGAFLVLRTSILHQNLKWILVALCLHVILFAISRCYMLLGAFFSGALLWLPPLPSLAINFSLIVFGNLIGHALIIERILATIWVETYENYQGHAFTVAWILITVVLSFSNSYYQFSMDTSKMVSISQITLYTHVVAMVASLAEIFIISLVTYMNVKRFKINGYAPKVHPLTVRYQLTENIRTGKQLGPTFVCHFLTVTLSFLVIMNSCAKWITDFEAVLLIMAFAFVIHSVNNLMLIATLIVFHPMLNRKARKVLKDWSTFCTELLHFHAHSHPSLAPPPPPPLSNSIPTLDTCPLPVDVNGMVVKPSKRRSQQLKPSDTYFRQLHRAWGDYLH